MDYEMDIGNKKQPCTRIDKQIKKKKKTYIATIVIWIAMMDFPLPFRAKEIYGIHTVGRMMDYD